MTRVTHHIPAVAGPRWWVAEEYSCVICAPHRPLRRRLAVCATAALAAITLTNLSANTASADDPDPTSSTDAWLASLQPGFADNQNTITQFNGWLMQQTGIHDAGYVASIDDASSNTVTMLWNGTNAVPASVSEQAAADGITLTTQAWSLSYTQIQSVSDLLGNATSTLYSVLGFNLADVVGLDPTFAGVTIEGTFNSSVIDIGAATSRLVALAQTTAGVPVRVNSDVITGAALGRDNDFAPFNAGGLMYSPSAPSNDNLCSSGFGVKISGVTHTTTARHCPYTDYESDGAPSNKYAAGHNTRVDPGAGRYLGGTASALSWDGAYNTQDYTKTVIGYSDLGVGDYVCTDGGNSGVHCNVKVTSLSVYWNDGTGHGNVETIKGVQQTSGRIAVIQGDSGGPVIIPVSNGTQVRAAGMIQAYSGSYTTGSGCGPVRYAGANRCSTGVLFTSFRTIVNGISGGTLVTG